VISAKGKTTTAHPLADSSLDVRAQIAKSSHKVHLDQRHAPGHALLISDEVDLCVLEVSLGWCLLALAKQRHGPSTHVVTQISQAPIQRLHHAQESFAEYQILAGVMEHPLRLL
jgi:hypothetical protein